MKVQDTINKDEIVNLKGELENWTEYIPLALMQLAPKDYWKKCTDEAKSEYRKKRQEYDGTSEYSINDIMEWVKKYPQFEKYILKE